MSENSGSSGGISFTSLLQVAFIVLKLCRVIDWTWWWVLSPTWIGVAFWLLIVVVIAIFKIAIEEEDEKIIDQKGQLKSKWEQRLDEMHRERQK